jgi:hypothetical protein
MSPDPGVFPVVRRFSVGVVLVAGSRFRLLLRDRSMGSAGVSGEAAVWGAVLDGVG